MRMTREKESGCTRGSENDIVSGGTATEKKRCTTTEREEETRKSK